MTEKCIESLIVIIIIIITTATAIITYIFSYF